MSSSCEDDDHLASQDIPCLLWNKQVHYPVLKPVEFTLTPFFLNINFDIIFSSAHSSPKWLLPFKFPD